MINRLFANPYFYSGAILAKLLTCIGTIVWAAVVLSRANALSTPAYADMVSAMPEDVWAGGAMAIACALMARLFIHSKPTWFGTLGWLVLMLLWLYAWASMILFYQTSAFPNGFSGCTVMMVCAVSSFVTNPKIHVPADH